MQFEVKTIKNFNAEQELKNIGFDSSYIACAALKHNFLSLKIKNLPCHTASIIKETALSKGADAGVSRGVLLREVEKTDLILTGTHKQLQDIAQSLNKQPFGLKEIGKEIVRLVENDNRTTNRKIMGILNITEDSFSDGGKFINPNDAIKQAEKLITEGADIIDAGAESTRPNASPIDSETEIKRLTPVIKEITKWGKIISIDTRNSKTAEAMLKLGVNIINDVSMLKYDENMLNIIRDYECKYVLNHSRGLPSNMDTMVDYENVADEVYTELHDKIDYLNKKGIENSRIIADVGFGFAKNIKQNFELLKRISEFRSLGVKTMAGVSRKRFIKSLAKDDNYEDADTLTAITSFYLFENNIDIVRIHNVKETKLALELYDSIYGQKSCL